MRKKRLIAMIIVVVSCALFLSVTGYMMMKKDEEEYARWLEGYRGIWISENGQYEVSLYRVTSAHMIFSIENKEKKRSLSYVAAVATGDEEYTFTFDFENYKENTVNKSRFVYGTRYQGDFVLNGKEIQVDIASIGNDENDVRGAGDISFKGVLKRKAALPQEKRTDLMRYMGKAVPQDYQKGETHFQQKEQEDEMHYYLEEQAGKVSRSHIIWMGNKNRLVSEYSNKYMLDGIHPYCMVSDLKSRFGNPIAEEELDDHRHKYVYEKEGYRYQFITEGYGLVVEADCQLIEPLRGQRKGDFIVEGDTVLRYLGDYDKKHKIKLPAGTKRIATGAFTEGDAALSTAYAHVTELNIPEDVKVEPYAFRNCGKLKIKLEKGWTTVEEESFAGMVSEKQQDARKQWVEISLPSSMRYLKKNAFTTEVHGLTDTTGFAGNFVQSVVVRLNNGLQYIEDDALKGILCDIIPTRLIEVGTNFYCALRTGVTDYSFPSTLKKIARSTLFSPGRRVILNGDIPEMTGELNYSTEEFWFLEIENFFFDSYCRTEIYLKDEKKYDQLLKNLMEGQHLTRREKKEIEVLLDNGLKYDLDKFYRQLQKERGVKKDA